MTRTSVWSGAAISGTVWFEPRLSETNPTVGTVVLCRLSAASTERGIKPELAVFSSPTFDEGAVIVTDARLPDKARLLSSPGLAARSPSRPSVGSGTSGSRDTQSGRLRRQRNREPFGVLRHGLRVTAKPSTLPLAIATVEKTRHRQRNRAGVVITTTTQARD